MGLPVALIASLAIVFGTTPDEGVLIDCNRYDITFLTGVEAVVAWTALALGVALGPTVIGAVVGIVWR